VGLSPPGSERSTEEAFPRRALAVTPRDHQAGVRSDPCPAPEGAPCAPGRIRPLAAMRIKVPLELPFKGFILGNPVGLRKGAGLRPTLADKGKGRVAGGVRRARKKKKCIRRSWAVRRRFHKLWGKPH